VNGKIKFVSILFLGKVFLLSLAGSWVNLEAALHFVVEKKFQCLSCTTELNRIMTTVNILILQKKEQKKDTFWLGGG
jgi:hypothetical protein